ncbi:MAG: hypothetical protein BroJett011_24700 [Chloroflexota bacterium]|nr:MAG: hypothetical protein BroJett011_24700 [Chloroflexota bacterium]
MDGSTSIDLTEFLYPLLILIGIALTLALLLLGWIIWRVRRINLPPDADWVTALRATPFVVVLLLDLLDFGLDFLSAPFAWILLSYLGLKPLRAVTTIESLIPGTQFLPTMTAAWVIARFVKRERLQVRG